MENKDGDKKRRKTKDHGHYHYMPHFWQKRLITSTLIGSWWRHEMQTFSALLALYAGNSLFYGEFPSQRPMTRSFDVFFDLRLNKLLSKQSWGWWFETPSSPSWRHCNVQNHVLAAVKANTECPYKIKMCHVLDRHRNNLMWCPMDIYSVFTDIGKSNYRY